MSRITKILAFFLMTTVIFGFEKPANAFDALNKDVNLSFAEVEDKVKTRDIYLTDLTFLAKIKLEILN